MSRLSKNAKANIEALCRAGKHASDIASVLPHSVAVIKRHIDKIRPDPLPAGTRVRHSGYYFKKCGGAGYRDREGTVVRKTTKVESAKTVLWDGDDEPSPWHIRYLEPVVVGHR